MSTRDPKMKTSPICKIFQGNIRLKLSKYGRRMKNSVSFQSFFSLHLDITNPKIRTLQQALSTYMAKEQVSGYRAAQSRRTIAAEQQVTIGNLPCVLILNLKRFILDTNQRKFIKSNKAISYQSCLTLQKRFCFHSAANTSQSDQTTNMSSNNTYRLRAVIVHHGAHAHNGHYTTYVRLDPTITKPTRHHGTHLKVKQNTNNMNYERWIHCNDQNVNQVHFSEVFSQPAYILFYERQSAN